MFLQVCVIMFTGGSASVHAGIPCPPPSRPPQSRHPSGSRPPRDQVHSPHPTPLGPGTPPRTRYTPRKADSGIRSTSGRYASYWNVFLFLKKWKTLLLFVGPVLVMSAFGFKTKVDSLACMLCHLHAVNSSGATPADLLMPGMTARPFLIHVRRFNRSKYQGSGAWPCSGLSLLKVYRKFNSKSNGANTAYICKHSACLHTQK